MLTHRPLTRKGKEIHGMGMKLFLIRTEGKEDRIVSVMKPL
jgi:hypothetical protein